MLGLAECHLAYPLVPWVVLSAVHQMLLFRHLLELLFLCHLRVHVLFRTVLVCFVGTMVGVVVLRTASDVQLEEVHQCTLVLLVLR